MKRSIKSLEATSRMYILIFLLFSLIKMKKTVVNMYTWVSTLHDVAIIAIFVAVAMPIELYGNYQNYTFPCDAILIPTMLDLDEPPTEDALSKMKRGKAGGKSGILPELVLYGGAILWDRLLELMQATWGRGEVVPDWKNAEVVPIPKKGDLQRCDNWCGISLLDVVGKLFARVIQERLQVIAERVLPDSQCGFRKGQGCCDMIFVARQLMEKAREPDMGSITSKCNQLLLLLHNSLPYYYYYYITH